MSKSTLKEFSSVTQAYYPLKSLLRRFAHKLYLSSSPAHLARTLSIIERWMGDANNEIIESSKARFLPQLRLTLVLDISDF